MLTLPNLPQYNKWIWLATVVGLCLLLFIAFRSCDHIPKPVEKKAAKDSIVHAVIVADKADKIIIDSLKQELGVAKAALVKLQKAKVVTDHDLDQTEAQVASLLNDYWTAKHTLETQPNCDSLANATGELINAAEQHQILFDETVANYDIQMRIKDGIIEQDSVTKETFRAGFGQLSTQYDGLMQDYGKVRKKANRQAALSRLLAIIAASATAAFILKR